MERLRTASPLDRIHFGKVGPHPVAGMGEPWQALLDETFLRLKEEGVGAILTLTEDDLFAREYVQAGFLHHHAPIDDYEAPEIPILEGALAFMDAALAQGAGVAVHCLEGRGRTGAVLCAWLARKEGLAAQDAIDLLRRWRPITALSPSQKAFLLSYLS